MKTIGIVVHSAEGGALCFITACREGAMLLGEHRHPPIVLSAIPMNLSMRGWESGDLAQVAVHLREGVRQVAAAGAEFYLCPDNTAHIVLESIAGKLPLPGLHIAEVVAAEIRAQGWHRVGLLGTEWTMAGPVYARILEESGMQQIIPASETRAILHARIFDELCNGIFSDSTRDRFLAAVTELKELGAECVILGCTEIPLVVTPENSPLPILDSTRLLARYAVAEAVYGPPFSIRTGWLAPRRPDAA